ncbi:MAG: ECF-type sigma factor [Gemmatimonadota bacterium]
MDLSNDTAAADLVFDRAYAELRRLARTVRRDRPGATLQTTELLHEAWLKLRGNSPPNLDDADHLRRIVARAIRQLLVDGARRRTVRKKYGHIEVTGVSDRQRGEPLARRAARIIEIDRALAALARDDPRRAAVVECRFFGGMSVEETARALDVSEATVKRDWRVARAYLGQALDGERA